LKDIRKRFGFDLDNTLIDYSDAVKEYCRIKSLNHCSDVVRLRDELGKNHTSDHAWQLAQAWLYTEGLKFAQIGVGALNLCNYLESEGYQLYIVSHKTSHTPNLSGRIALHKVANNWISSSPIAKFFKEKQQIYFEPTRILKVKRIQDLSLNYFVDDLEEVFNTPDFPINTKNFLISTRVLQNSKFTCVRDFNSIREILANGF